jgi:peptidoglycan/LPS O-acetylase OafA/YrhL
VVLTWWSQRDGLSRIVVWSILTGAPAAGLVVGSLRAWRWSWLGLAVGGALLVASALASNDTLAGSEDMSWRILLIAAAVVTPVLFYPGVMVGAAARWLTGRLRARG